LEVAAPIAWTVVATEVKRQLGSPLARPTRGQGPLLDWCDVHNTVTPGIRIAQPSRRVDPVSGFVHLRQEVTGVTGALCSVRWRTVVQKTTTQ
jgi:hypothetical protein